MLSIVYAVATAVIIGYGARILRLGDEEKRRLYQAEEKLKQVEEKYSKTAEQVKSDLSEWIKSSFDLYNKTYIATTACQHAGYLCTLLESHIELCKQNGKKANSVDDYVNSLHVNFIRSLTTVCMFIEPYANDRNEMTDEAFNSFDYSWKLAKYSMDSYIVGTKERSPLVRSLFPEDEDSEEYLRELYKRIDESVRTIRKSHMQRA